MSYYHVIINHKCTEKKPKPKKPTSALNSWCGQALASCLKNIWFIPQGGHLKYSILIFLIINQKKHLYNKVITYEIITILILFFVLFNILKFSFVFIFPCVQLINVSLMYGHKTIWICNNIKSIHIYILFKDSLSLFSQ